MVGWICSNFCSVERGIDKYRERSNKTKGGVLLLLLEVYIQGGLGMEMSFGTEGGKWRNMAELQLYRRMP